MSAIRNSDRLSLDYSSEGCHFFCMIAIHNSDRLSLEYSSEGGFWITWGNAPSPAYQVQQGGVLAIGAPSPHEDRERRSTGILECPWGRPPDPGEWIGGPGWRG